MFLNRLATGPVDGTDHQKPGEGRFGDIETCGYGRHMTLTEIDRSLLKRCLAEEPGAWKDFVDRFMGLFVHVVTHTAHARSVRLAQDDVDDLCAEVFMALLANDYAALRRFRGQSSLATYLTVIARRVVVHTMRPSPDGRGARATSWPSIPT